jgi:hypothetical protein
MGGRVIARGIGLGLLAMALNVAIAFLWVWFYSVAINPGHGGDHYQLYGQRVAPIVGIAAGIPLLLAAGWLTARATSRPLAAFIPALTYIVVDVALMVAGNLWAPGWSLALSYLTKLAASWAGGRLAGRRRV